MGSMASVMEGEVGDTTQSSLRAWVVVLTASLFFFYEFIILNIFNSLGTSLIKEFHINATDLGSLSSYYFYANLIFLFPAGMILDRVSTKRLILAAMMICVGSTFVFSHAPNMMVMKACRFAMGVGGAFCLLSAVRLASRWFPAKKMAFVVGAIVTMAFIGGMCAQYAKPIISIVGWRHTLFYIACLGSLMTVAIFLFVQDFPDDYKIEEHHHHAAAPFKTAIKLSVLNVQNWLAGLYTSLLNLSVFILGALFGNMYLTQVYHLTSMQASSVCSMIFFGTIFGSPAIGWFSDRVGLRKMPMILFGVLSLIVVAMVLYGVSFWSYHSLVVLFFLIGFFTSSQVIGYPLIAEHNKRNVTATATGLGSTLIMGGGLTQILVGYLLDSYRVGHQVIDGVAQYSPSTFNFAFSILPLGIIFGLVVSFFIKETHCIPKD